MHTPTVAPLIVTRLLAAARRRGLDVDALCRQASIALPASPGYSERLPAANLHALWEVAAEALGDWSGFSLMVADVAPTEARSPLHFLVRAQPTLGDALDLGLRYWPAYTDAYRWRREDRRTTTVVAASGAGERLGERATVEHDLLDMVRNGRQIVSAPFPLIEVRLRHAPLASPAAYADAFGAPVRFGWHRDEMVMARAGLSLPCVHADPVIAGYLEEDLARIVARFERPGTARERLEGFLTASLPHDPGLDAASRHLGMSPRSLHRRLSEEGCSYRDARDTARFQLAAEWLLREPVERVAERLGYSEPRAFRRAFKRWTGRAPDAWRRHLPAVAASPVRPVLPSSV